MSGFYYYVGIPLAILAIQLLIGIAQLIFRAYRSHKNRVNEIPGENRLAADRESGPQARHRPMVSAVKFFVVLFLGLLLTVHMLLDPTSYKHWAHYLIFVFFGMVITIQYIAWRHPDLLARIIADPVRYLFQKQVTADHYRCGHCGYNLTGHLHLLQDEKQNVVCPECGMGIDEVGMALPGYADRRTIESFKAKLYFALSVAAAFYLCLIVLLRIWLISFPFVAVVLWLTMRKWQQYKSNNV